MYRFRKWIGTRAISFSFKISCENISFSSLLVAGDVSPFTRRFLRAKRPKWRRARRNECFRRLHSKQIYMKLSNIHFPLFYFNIIGNRLRMIMHHHTKKKTKRKRNTDWEVNIEPHRIPRTLNEFSPPALKRSWRAELHCAWWNSSNLFLLTTRELTYICGRIWIFRRVFSVNWNIPSVI